MLEALSAAAPFIADVLVLLGVSVMSIGVYGAIRMPDTFTKLHAMSKAVFLGVISLCAASLATAEGGIIFRVILIAVFLIVTTPIGAFAIARAAYIRGEGVSEPESLE